MSLLYALNEIGEWCIANPWRAGLSLGLVCLLTVAVCELTGASVWFVGPPTVACWLLGVHIRLQLGDE
jgi:hypothetical protein